MEPYGKMVTDENSTRGLIVPKNVRERDYFNPYFFKRLYAMYIAPAVLAAEMLI